MTRAWPASLGALLLIALTISLLWRQDPLEFTSTSYGTMPGATGALHDVLVLLDVPIERSFAAPDALPSRGTVWWIEPDRICEKLASGASLPGGPDAAPDLDLAPWLRAGGTGVLFAPGLADCEGVRRVADLALPAPRMPGFRVEAEEPEDAGSPEDAAPSGVAPRADWVPQRVTGPLVAAPRDLPLPTLARFEEVPDGFSVVASVDDAPFALEAAVGAGRLVLVADAIFLHNLWLDAGDAAPLAFDWVRAYGVPRLDEREHGLSDTPSTPAYLVRSPALAVFAGLTASALLFGWAGASLPRRRAGEPLGIPPTLRTYVDSLARLYARAGDHAEAFERYREHALAMLRVALQLAHDASPVRVAATLRSREGVDESDLDALLPERSVAGDADLERACRSLDRLLENVR